jgi:hypothetical protein
MFVVSFSTIIFLKSTPVSEDGRISKYRTPCFFGEEQDAISKSSTDGMTRFFTKRVYVRLLKINITSESIILLSAKLLIGLINKIFELLTYFLSATK